MRLNKFLALSTSLSRRAADQAILSGRVSVNSEPAQIGQEVTSGDKVILSGMILKLPRYKTVLFNKPVGYIVSRAGQGNKTIYDILPDSLRDLKPVGRLDKDSSGLLVLTNNGDLAQRLTHPSFQKTKIYQVTLDKPLSENHKSRIQKGLTLEDGISRLGLNGSGMNWAISMEEGRNRQIRRTFQALGYKILKLHRTSFGSYEINQLKTGEYIAISTDDIL
ncbi:MAG TPA: pseudouridine synthase [Candidatus Saccharimonadales bacterium]|nr:pseudouridine synthase [Candidatus Saccharimonadales bacterium]